MSITPHKKISLSNSALDGLNSMRSKYCTLQLIEKNSRRKLELGISNDNAKIDNNLFVSLAFYESVNKENTSFVN